MSREMHSKYRLFKSNAPKVRDFLVFFMNMNVISNLKNICEYGSCILHASISLMALKERYTLAWGEAPCMRQLKSHNGSIPKSLAITRTTC